MKNVIIVKIIMTCNDMKYLINVKEEIIYTPKKKDFTYSFFFFLNI